MLYNIKKESEVYLSPFFFVDTENDEQKKRLVKTVELNLKSPNYLLLRNKQFFLNNHP